MVYTVWIAGALLAIVLMALFGVGPGLALTGGVVLLGGLRALWQRRRTGPPTEDAPQDPPQDR